MKSTESDNCEYTYKRHLFFSFNIFKIITLYGKNYTID